MIGIPSKNSDARASTEASPRGGTRRCDEDHRSIQTGRVLFDTRSTGADECEDEQIRGRKPRVFHPPPARGSGANATKSGGGSQSCKCVLRLQALHQGAGAHWTETDTRTPQDVPLHIPTESLHCGLPLTGTRLTIRQTVAARFGSHLLRSTVRRRNHRPGGATTVSGAPQSRHRNRAPARRWRTGAGA